MGRKIKSVKLKNDYRDENNFIPAGTKVTSKGSDLWILGEEYWIPEIKVISNKTDLFDIEYETERKSITVKIEYDYSPGDSLLSATNIAYSLDGDYNINPKVTKVTND